MVGTKRSPPLVIAKSLPPSMVNGENLCFSLTVGLGSGLGGTETAIARIPETGHDEAAIV